MSSKSLICVTTCNRPDNFLAYSPDYIAFCLQREDYHFVLCCDGSPEDYLSFCERYGVDLVWSERGEGVGVAKNRVYLSYPDFDYYFFIEDDVELVDPSFFDDQISISEASGIHHFSQHERRKLRSITGQLRAKSQTILLAEYGSAQINFFTNEALQKVGGWHPLFATYRRFGHTEHSYRIARANLMPKPFCYVEDFEDRFLFHIPPPVSKESAQKIPRDKSGIALPERKLMEEELTYYPFETPSEYSVKRNTQTPEQIAAFYEVFNRAKQYPFLSFKRSQIKALYYRSMGLKASSIGKRLSLYVISLLLHPTSFTIFNLKRILKITNS